MCFCTREEEVRWRRMVLCMAVDGLFPPESRRMTTSKCNRCKQLLRALFGAGSTIGRLAGEGRRSNFPHATGCRMRLRARLAARSGDQAAAVEASSNNDACETEADDFASCAPTEGPSAKEVGRAFLGDPEAEPAGHGGRSVSAAKASSHLRSLLLRFQRPHDEDEHSAASTCAGGNGEDYAYHGGAIFADDSRDFDFGGDGHAALAAALFSETRDPDQVSNNTGVAEGAADGRLACSAERTTWFEDDCCDFDLEVPEPSMLRCGSVPGNRTQEPERNQQDPQRAKNGVDNGPLPQERFEKRPTGQRSHSVSSLTPLPSPEWAPLIPSASPSASHGFRSADSALRGVSDCLPSSVAPLRFSPPSPCGSLLGFVAEDLLPNPVPPFGFRPLSPKGLPQDSDTECPLGLDISGCTGRVRSLSGEGNLTSCVLRAGLCARVSFAHGGSSWPKDPSISPECERACSSTGHDSTLASSCLPPSGHTGGSGSHADNDRPIPSAFDGGPHTQVPFAAGGSSRPQRFQLAGKRHLVLTIIRGSKGGSTVHRRRRADLMLARPISRYQYVAARVPASRK